MKTHQPTTQRVWNGIKLPQMVYNIYIQYDVSSCRGMMAVGWHLSITNIFYFLHLTILPWRVTQTLVSVIQNPHKWYTNDGVHKAADFPYYVGRWPDRHIREPWITRAVAVIRVQRRFIWILAVSDPHSTRFYAYTYIWCVSCPN